MPVSRLGGDRVLEQGVAGLTRVFAATPDKREAHRKSRDLLAEMAADPAFLTALLRKHLETPDAFDHRHYPTVSLQIAINPYFEFVANCWIPLPGRETDVSTKAIHHHGDMLLTTATAFGPGYEHWLFTRPLVVDADRELYAMTVVERGPHPLHHVAFVDSQLPHLPLFPPELTITFALWSGSKPTSWKDRAKRLPLLKRNQALLRNLAVRAGLSKSLDLNVVEYFDFYPTEDGFKGMKDRKEFDRGPNADYLFSLFHILQETGNRALASVVKRRLDGGAATEDPELARQLLDELEAGRRIDARLSEGHYGVPFANFTKQDIQQALAAQESRREALVGR